MTAESVAAKKSAKKTTKKPSAPKHEIQGLDPDFDLDAWIDGTTGATARAKIVRRGDLIAERQRLQEELRTVRQVRPADRGVGDRSPESVQDDLDRVEAEIWESAIVVTMQDRTDAHRREVHAAVAEEIGLSRKDDPQRYTEVTTLAEIADSIIKLETADGREVPLPAGGIGWERLQAIREQSGEAALIELADRYNQMKSTSPAVQAPF